MLATALDVTFTKLFGAPPEVIAHAPGRANLIGDHADCVSGLVLSLAIPQETSIALAPRERRTVRAAMDAAGAGEPVAFDLGSEALRGTWIDAVAGTVVALLGAGYDVGGFDVAVASNVPSEAGLAESVSLEVALLRGLRAAFSLDLDDVALAKISHAAESDFVGAPTSMTDHMAASLADVSTALLLDTRTLGWQRLPLPEAGELAIVATPDGCRAGARAGGDARYARRRAECERAAELLVVETLRDVSDPAALAALPEPLCRRTRHVFTENARVAEAAVALRAGDIERLGRAMDASHASLRDDFDASTPAVDRLVALAQGDEDVFGARVACGRSGATILALARRGRGAEVARRLVRDGDGVLVLVPPEDGAAADGELERQADRAPDVP